MSQELFTIREFYNYLMSQDSRGDILYNLSAENIIKANQLAKDDEVESPNAFEYIEFMKNNTPSKEDNIGNFPYGVSISNNLEEHDKKMDELNKQLNDSPRRSALLPDNDWDLYPGNEAGAFDELDYRAEAIRERKIEEGYKTYDDEIMEADDGWLTD